MTKIRIKLIAMAVTVLVLVLFRIAVQADDVGKSPPKGKETHKDKDGKKVSQNTEQPIDDEKPESKKKQKLIDDSNIARPIARFGGRVETDVDEVDNSNKPIKLDVISFANSNFTDYDLACASDAIATICHELTAR